MTDPTTEKPIEMMVQRLVDRFAPDQIILFGSQARGAAPVYSSESAIGFGSHSGGRSGA